MSRSAVEKNRGEFTALGGVNLKYLELGRKNNFMGAFKNTLN